MNDPLSANFEENSSLSLSAENEDLFVSIYECDKQKHEKHADKEDDIFAEANEYFEDIAIDQCVMTSNKQPSPYVHQSSQHPQQSNEANEESKHFIAVTVKDPRKVGEGLNAYVVYKICTNTNLPEFQLDHAEVTRRFSDFLYLHSKLVDKYKQLGTIIPSPPEKNAIGTTRVKISRDESTCNDFIEHRREALERFLRCICKHPTLRVDPNVVDFLELEGTLPRSSSSSTMSSSSRVLRFINKVGENISKLAIYKMDDAEEWLEDKQQQVELMEVHLRSMYNNVEELYAHRKGYTISLSKSIDWLSTTEEHVSLSRALSSLAETLNECGYLYSSQSNADFYILLQLVNQHLGLCQSAKDSFQERVRLYKLCKEDDAMKKKMMASKNEMTASCGPEDGQGQLSSELQQTSSNIMKEMKWMDDTRASDFKEDVTQYMQIMLNQQMRLAEMWEAFLGVAKDIS
ncbi:hypothetical protein HELRODRAFT_99725 [Helobdella robusta]|uniref:PX domain-containing protein n=1 Tax=Helobdella robusta TaxID=6412 RepID=T1G9U9_HELRO|nr:hypothetical protein HELRODRAFT_99725 [Helobdella robusta]ESO03902.1 hypothetical protein HELRODRAFT_99725 [Helobdella robusta]